VTRHMIPNQLPSIWLGEARAHLHAAVRVMAQPRLRIVHARKAWTFAMGVLINEADDAQPSELDAAAVFADEAVGHITAARAELNGSQPSFPQ
jgi:hypothetical protein